MRLAKYYHLVKPGIVYGNLITAIAGYLLASDLRIYPVAFAMMAIGTALVMASACVINNLADRDIDSKMERTKKRPSASRDVSLTSGVIYAIALAIIGFALIVVFVNKFCAVVGFIGFIDYAWLYTYLKRRTYHATLIGSLAGAAPIVGGYVAYADHFSTAALIIGVMMLVWQMPHFYAIALYREKDYREADIPVMPVVLGRGNTARWMVFYSLIFLLASMALYFNGPAGIVYLIVMGLVALIWLGYNLGGLKGATMLWARKSFFLSLAVMVIMSVMVALR